MKGHNLFAPGHVGEILLNRATVGAVHAGFGVIASVHGARYDVKWMENQQCWFRMDLRQVARQRQHFVSLPQQSLHHIPLVRCRLASVPEKDSAL